MPNGKSRIPRYFRVGAVTTITCGPYHIFQSRYRHFFSPLQASILNSLSSSPHRESSTMESANFIPLGFSKERHYFDQPGKPEKPPKVIGDTKGDSQCPATLYYPLSANEDIRGAQEDCPRNTTCSAKREEEDQVRC